MRHGFISVAAGTPEIRVGDCAFNENSIVDVISRARSKGASLLVLPELSITGCTCGDLFLQSELLDAAERSLISIIDKTSDMLVVIGVPLRRSGKLYNCAAVACGGKLIGVTAKSSIPSCELRHFAKAPEKQSSIRIGGEDVHFGASLVFSLDDNLCIGVEIGGDLTCVMPPSSKMALMGANVILNPSAFPEEAGERERRRLLIAAQSARLNCAYINSNAGYGESTTDMVFSGHNIIAENGEILAVCEPFESASPIAVTEIDIQRLTFLRRRNSTFVVEPCDPIEFTLKRRETRLTRHIDRLPFVPVGVDRYSQLESILLIQANGLKKRLEHTGAKPVIGVSGGLDSTLALLVTLKAAELMGNRSQIIQAVTMPCFGTSHRTYTNARRLCDELGIPLRHIDITDSVKRHLSDIEHPGGKHDATYENAQARERTQVLMDIANQLGGIVIGTGDLSELALGWATYNGDHMSMYSVNASIPKTLVRELVKCYAERSDKDELRAVLFDILDTPISPELMPLKQGEIAQNTEGIVGPYELHDFFLYHFLCFGAPPDKIQRIAEYAFDGTYVSETIARWLKVFFRRFFSQQFKRSCMPDCPKVTPVSLSPRGGWNMPSDISIKINYEI